MSNSTHGFIINPQLDIQSTDEYKIKISGSAIKCALGNRCFIIVFIVVPGFNRSQIRNNVVMKVNFSIDLTL